jgi:two-component system CheB/CheR fusion protein
VLRVSDNGIGIPADLMPSLFDVFSQGSRTLDRSEGGLGIGLSLAKRLVEKHGGTIEAHSGGAGQGSEFTVRLPRLATRAPFPEAPAVGVRSASETAAGVKRILVVDDNRDAAETLGMLLTLEGHEVCSAYDASSAIEAARTFRPQLILLDIGLPEMDGFEVAKILRQIPETRDADLIAITGYAEPEMLQRSREAGFRRHLVKPVDVDDLLETLKP